MSTRPRICGAALACVAASGSVRADDTGLAGAVPYGVAGAAAGVFDVHRLRSGPSLFSREDPAGGWNRGTRRSASTGRGGHLRGSQSAACRRRPRPQRGMGRLGGTAVRSWDLGDRRQQREAGSTRGAASARQRLRPRPRPFAANSAGIKTDDDLVDGATILVAVKPNLTAPATGRTQGARAECREATCGALFVTS